MNNNGGKSLTPLGGDSFLATTRGLNHAVRVAMYVKQVRDTIKENGWMVQGVFPTAHDPGPEFVYTVGLTEKDRPELVIVGLPLNLAAELINSAAEAHLEKPFEPGGIATGFAEVDFRVVEAPHAEVGTANRVYRDREIKVLQLLWPDNDGNYPGDPGWNPESLAQPIYDQKGGRR